MPESARFRRLGARVPLDEPMCAHARHGSPSRVACRPGACPMPCARERCVHARCRRIPTGLASSVRSVALRPSHNKDPGGETMTQHKSGSDLSRRGLIAAAGIGAVAMAPAILRAQTPAAPAPAPAAPASTITNPPRDFGPERRADDLLPRSRHDHRRSGVQRHHPAQRRHHAPVDRRAVVGRAGLERAGSLSRVERHPEQPPAALARGRRPRERLPRAVEQQQRQHASISRAGSSPAST